MSYIVLSNLILGHKLIYLLYISQVFIQFIIFKVLSKISLSYRRKL